jgi:ABC-type Na+ efflux pump permease subunit
MSFRRAVAYIPAMVALLPYAVFAQQGGLPKQIVPCNGVDCGCDDLITLAQNIINGMIFLSVFLAAILFAYAGWLYLSNEAIGQKDKAKKLFSNVAIGLIVIMVAWLVVDTLMRSLLKDSVVWNNICSGLGL